MRQRAAQSLGSIQAQHGVPQSLLVRQGPTAGWRDVDGARIDGVWDASVQEIAADQDPRNMSGAHDARPELCAHAHTCMRAHVCMHVHACVQAYVHACEQALEFSSSHTACRVSVALLSS